jgi:uncharacterized membrane protein YeaQ/YmgE (transglycosylase-associated protein family)
MGVIGWIVVGLIAGALAQRATGARRHGCLTTMAVGILGGVIGGALFNAMGDRGITEFGLWSILVAFIGACALLLVLQALGVVGRRR